jgi:hypothetical protein
VPSLASTANWHRSREGLPPRPRLGCQARWRGRRLGFEARVPGWSPTSAAPESPRHVRSPARQLAHTPSPAARRHARRATPARRPWQSPARGRPSRAAGPGSGTGGSQATADGQCAGRTAGRARGRRRGAPAWPAPSPIGAPPPERPHPQHRSLRWPNPPARTVWPGLPPTHTHRPQSGKSLVGDRKRYRKWLAGKGFTVGVDRARVKSPYKVGHLRAPITDTSGLGEIHSLDLTAGGHRGCTGLPARPHGPASPRD